jgi:hypothetical protein
MKRQWEEEHPEFFEPFPHLPSDAAIADATEPHRCSSAFCEECRTGRWDVDEADEAGRTRSNGWKGGRTTHAAGYAMVYRPDHARAGPNGYVLEHILIAERALGHSLPLGAEVHHVDENKANNGRGNHVLCQSRAYHLLLHKRQRALDACGDPNAVRCGYCAGYDGQAEMYIATRKNGSRTGYHKDCGRAYERRVDRAAAALKEIQ